ncbi:MAG: PKD domain-containing protein, partial [Bacteroidota bacterium]
MKKLFLPLLAFLFIAGCSAPPPDGPVQFSHTANERTVDFSQKVEGFEEVTSYTWDFGDGSVAQGATVSHEYEKGDYYDVTLTAMNSCGDAKSITMEVAADPSFDKKVDHGFQPVTDFINSIIFVSFTFPGGIQVPIVLVILILGALYFTFYFRFVNFRKFGLAVDIVRGKYTDPTEKGEVSHFQALTAALSGTVGLGNIAGV